MSNEKKITPGLHVIRINANQYTIFEGRNGVEKMETCLIAGSAGYMDAVRVDYTDRSTGYIPFANVEEVRLLHE